MFPGIDVATVMTNTITVTNNFEDILLVIIAIGLSLGIVGRVKGWFF